MLCYYRVQLASCQHSQKHIYRGKSPYGESSVLPASEDLMGNMRTRFLRGLFIWRDTGQSL